MIAGVIGFLRGRVLHSSPGSRAARRLGRRLQRSHPGLDLLRDRARRARASRSSSSSAPTCARTRSTSTASPPLPEKRVFEALIAVSGIGPRLAQVILSGMGWEDLLDALAAGDVARLTRIPGVGKKTSERMVVELRDVSDAADEGARARAVAPAGRSGRRPDLGAGQPRLPPARRREGGGGGAAGGGRRRPPSPICCAPA